MIARCPYCLQKARLVSGLIVYPHIPELHAGAYWQCEPCGAYVGCHAQSNTSFGTPANAELRRERRKAHEAFDSIRKEKHNGVSRSQAYARLADRLGIDVDRCHIGLFDIDTCRKVQEICNAEKETIT